jgi:hypothetical protein
MGFFSRKRRPGIALEFVDADSGQPLCKSDSAPEDLPESFAGATSVRIQGIEHDVIKAVPAEAVEFRKSRRVKLWVRRRVFVPLNRILFSRPTITDRLPSCGPSQGRDLYALPADDWRQVEFVSRAALPEVECELAEIRSVHSGARVEWGWSRMHLRRAPARPLGGVRIPFADAWRRLRPDARRFDGLALKGETGAVEDGFAFETGSLQVVYGRTAGEELREFCLGPHKGGPGDAAALAALAGDHDLVLVDWCRAQVVASGPGELRAWLRR